MGKSSDLPIFHFWYNAQIQHHAELAGLEALDHQTFAGVTHQPGDQQAFVTVAAP